MTNDINFVHVGMLSRMTDLDLFLQGFQLGTLALPTWEEAKRFPQVAAGQYKFETFDDRDTNHPFKNTQTLADLVTRAGCFPSKAQAKKNGWNRPIPPGFSQFTIGQRRRMLITILNRFDAE